MGTADRPVWTGSDLPVDRRGMRILGTPLGSPEFVERQLQELREEHELLLHSLQALPELQSGWLLLSMCASTRANYYLRTLPPSQVQAFAQAHDIAMCRVLFQLLDDPGGTEEQLHHARRLAQLPLRLGGLGLAGAVHGCTAAYWASWADCLRMVRQRHPALAAHFVRALEAPMDAAEPCFCASSSLLDASCFTMAMLNAPLGKVWLRAVGQLRAPRSMGNGRKVGSVKLLELAMALLLMLT